MMKRIALFPLAFLLLGNFVFADDQLRDVQTQLKSQGFFYGEASGQASPETTAAIRRYQIRNGLEVTGSLSKETLASLGFGGGKSKTPAAPAPAPVKKEKAAPPPPNPAKDRAVEEGDRNFLRREESKPRPSTPAESLPPSPYAAPRDPSVINPPAPLEAPSPDFPVLFSGTPYANASREVQEQTLRRVQSILAGRGFYRDVVDGLPGPATEEALLSYQRSARLTMTGRLDLETLSELRVLPGSARATTSQRLQRVFRGIWIDIH